MIPPIRDVDAFLAEPITARVATNGPTVRPVWYHWEDGSFFVMSGPWANLRSIVEVDPKVVLIADVAELDTGRMMQVIAHGTMEVESYDIPRGRRLLYRYQGADESTWPRKPDRRRYLREPLPDGLVWLRLTPTRLRSYDYTDRNR